MKLPPDEARLLPLRAMACVLCVTPQDLKADALAGLVPCVRLGDDSLLFDRQEVERVLLERARAAQGDGEGGVQA